MDDGAIAHPTAAATYPGIACQEIGHGTSIVFSFRAAHLPPHWTRERFSRQLLSL